MHITKTLMPTKIVGDMTKVSLSFIVGVDCTLFTKAYVASSLVKDSSYIFQVSSHKGLFERSFHKLLFTPSSRISLPLNI